MHLLIYLAFGREHVSFESQSEVVCRLHQVLRGTDQNLIHWTSQRPRRLGHRSCLGDRETCVAWRLHQWKQIIIIIIIKGLWAENRLNHYKCFRATGCCKSNLTSQLEVTAARKQDKEQTALTRHVCKRHAVVSFTMSTLGLQQVMLNRWFEGNTGLLLLLSDYWKAHLQQHSFIFINWSVKNILGSLCCEERSTECVFLP